MSLAVQVKKETINANALFKALEDLLKMFPEKSDAWIDKSRNRLFDVVFLGFNKKYKRKEYKVYRNKEFDKAESKFSYYKVYYYGGKRAWCSCFYGKYGKTRMIRHCTHIGACILFDLYFKHLGSKS